MRSLQDPSSESIDILTSVEESETLAQRALSVGLEASRRLYVLKRGDKLQYFDAVRRIGLDREKTEGALTERTLRAF